MNALENGSIPSSVENLHIDHRLFKHDPHNLIPPSVSSMKISHWIYSSRDPDSIPLNVKSVSFINGETNKFIPGCIPSNITEFKMEFDFRVREPIMPGDLPISIKKLEFGDYKLPLCVGSIPLQVEEIQLGFHFHQEILPHVIPNGCKILSNSFLEQKTFQRNAFPASLTHFHSLTKTVNLLHPGILPPTLTHLTLRESFDPSVSVLPPWLEYLNCNFETVTVEMFENVKNLQTIVFHSQLQEIKVFAIPNSVTKIQFSHQVKINLISGTLPKENLTELYFEKGVSPFPVIPSSVTYLSLAKLTPRPSTPRTLPSSLKTLVLSGIYDPIESYDLQIPNTIQEIEIENKKHKDITTKRQLCLTIFNLFSQSTVRLKIIVLNVTLLSLDPSDPYIYFSSESSGHEGFILKSQIIPPSNSNLLNIFNFK
eukprot:gene4334-5424_t